MKAILQGWNLVRILRLGLGLVILVQGIIAKDALTIILGTAFSAMAIANIGCCGVNGCAVNPRPTHKTKEVQHEELDHTK